MYLYSRYIGIPFNKIENMVKIFKESNQQIKDITHDLVKETNNLISPVFMLEFINFWNNTFGDLEKNPIIHKEHKFDIDLKANIIEVTIEIKPVQLKKTVLNFHKSRNFSSHLDIYVMDIIDGIEKPVNLIFKEIREALCTIFGAFQIILKMYIFCWFQNLVFTQVNYSQVNRHKKV